MSLIFDDFNRADGLPGNGWSETGSRALVIRDGALTVDDAVGVTGIFRPIDLSGPISVSADITEMGTTNFVRRYQTSFLFGNAGDETSGYGVFVARGDQNYSDSRV